MVDFQREDVWFWFTCELFVEEMRDFQVKWGILVAKAFDCEGEMRDFWRENQWFSIKSVIFQEKMHDFRDEWGILKEKMRDFWVKWSNF